MITKWGVKNFKSILDVDLDLAPLTIFTGVNSSGKSSFLQSIVMMVQAARRGDKGKIASKGDLLDLGSFEKIYHKNSTEQKDQLRYEIGIDCTIPAEKYEYVHLKLELNKFWGTVTHELMECKEKKRDKDLSYIIYGKHGDTSNDTHKPVLDASSFREMLETIDPSGFSNDIIDPEKLEVIFDEYSFLPDRIINYYLYGTIYGFIQLLVDIPPKGLTNLEAINYADEKLSQLILGERIVTALLGYSTNNLIWYDLDQDDKFRTVIIPILFDRIPDFEKLFGAYKKYHDADKDEYYDISLSNWYHVLSWQDEDKKANIWDILKNGTYKDDLINLITENCGVNLDSIYSDCYFGLPKKLREARNHLYDYFKNKITYIGPLRLDPKDECSYKEKPKKMEKESDWDFEKRKAEYNKMMMYVGVKGENTMSIIRYLNDIRYDIDNYFSPKFLENPKYQPEKKKNSSEALVEWLQYFGMADDFKIDMDDVLKKTKLDEESIVINFVINGQKYSLTQLGTGNSQILPILVQGLITRVGSTLIIQEPEQSLHPKWQSRLADFFIAMSLSGRQCLIETHSEYIIKKLRHRIIENEDIKTNTKIYFAEKTDGKTEFEEIEINEYGAIMNWPDDFFDESSKEADDINKAASEKWEKNNKGQ